MERGKRLQKSESAKCLKHTFKIFCSLKSAAMSESQFSGFTVNMDLKSHIPTLPLLLAYEDKNKN